MSDPHTRLSSPSQHLNKSTHATTSYSNAHLEQVYGGGNGLLGGKYNYLIPEQPSERNPWDPPTVGSYAIPPELLKLPPSDLDHLIPECYRELTVAQFFSLTKDEPMHSSDPVDPLISSLSFSNEGKVCDTCKVEPSSVDAALKHAARCDDSKLNTLVNFNASTVRLTTRDDLFGSVREPLPGSKVNVAIFDAGDVNSPLSPEGTLHKFERYASDNFCIAIVITNSPRYANYVHPTETSCAYLYLQRKDGVSVSSVSHYLNKHARRCEYELTVVCCESNDNRNSPALPPFVLRRNISKFDQPRQPQRQIGDDVKTERTPHVSNSLKNLYDFVTQSTRGDPYYVRDDLAVGKSEREYFRAFIHLLNPKGNVLCVEPHLGLLEAFDRHGTNTYILTSRNFLQRSSVFHYVEGNSIGATRARTVVFGGRAMRSMEEFLDHEKLVAEGGTCALHVSSIKAAFFDRLIEVLLEKYLAIDFMPGCTRSTSVWIVCRRLTFGQLGPNVKSFNKQKARDYKTLVELSRRNAAVYDYAVMAVLNGVTMKQEELNSLTEAAEGESELQTSLKDSIQRVHDAKRKGELTRTVLIEYMESTKRAVFKLKAAGALTEWQEGHAQWTIKKVRGMLSSDQEGGAFLKWLRKEE